MTDAILSAKVAAVLGTVGDSPVTFCQLLIGTADHPCPRPVMVIPREEAPTCTPGEGQERDQD